MIPRHWALLGLIAFNAVLVFMVVHLTFFAAEGARYTAEEGRQDRAARIAADSQEREDRMRADRDIHLRIDNLHPHAWPAP
jgi:HJR/Mrr/RecB family endonuclease